MKLTKFERLLLINQFSIRKHLEPQSADYFDEMNKILSSGYEIFYGELAHWLHPDMPEEEGRFVLDVLDLFRAIERYKSEHSDDAEVVDHLWSHFMGFDGNNEGQYLDFARFLIKDQKKFAEQAAYEESTDGFNSHMPTKDMYV